MQIPDGSSCRRLALLEVCLTGVREWPDHTPVLCKVPRIHKFSLLTVLEIFPPFRSGENWDGKTGTHIILG